VTNGLAVISLTLNSSAEEVQLMAVYDDVAVATTTIEVLHPGIDLAVGASATTIQAGETITLTHLVTNTGEVPLANLVVITDNGTQADSADDSLCFFAELGLGQAGNCPLQIARPITTTAFRANVVAWTDAGLPLLDYELTTQTMVTITVDPVDVPPPDNNQTNIYLPLLVR
jgi:hypothetical protein